MSQPEVADIACSYCESMSTKKLTSPQLYTISGFRRHVAVDHGEGIYSAYECGTCNAKIYDFVHFENHVKANPRCGDHVTVSDIDMCGLDRRVGGLLWVSGPTDSLALQWQWKLWITVLVLFQLSGGRLPMNLVKSLEALVAQMKRYVDLEVKAQTAPDEKTGIMFESPPITRQVISTAPAPTATPVKEESTEMDERGFRPICQLCVELHQETALRDLQSKMHHAAAHIKESPVFASWTDDQVRGHRNFEKILGRCFKKVD